MPWTPPASVESVAIAPLDKGMRLDRPGQALEDGAFVRLENLIVNPYGLFKRPGYAEFAGGDTSPYTFEDVITLWNSAGTRQTVLLTARTLYEVSSTGGFTEVAWGYSTGTATITGTAVIGSGTAWDTNDIMEGDIFRVGTEEAEIDTVTDATHLSLKTASIADGSGSYSIQRAFGSGFTDMNDTVEVDGCLLIADGKRPLMYYDPNTHAIGYWITAYPATGTFVPGTVGVIGDRVWVGNVSDSTDGHTRQRLRWSTLANKQDFSLATSYLDLLYSIGTIRKLLPLGGYFVIYLDDAIYMGTPTSYPLAPIQFDKVETGGAGIPGVHCVCSYLNSHYFIGPDDIYILSAEGVTRVGAPILRDSIRATQLLTYSYVVADQFNNSMCFGIPGSTPAIQNVWRMQLQTKGWSVDQDVETNMLANPVINTNMTWVDLTGFTWDDLGGTYPTWEDMHVTETRRFLFIEANSALWRGSANSPTDLGTTAVSILAETKDHTFGDPDSIKTCTRLALKIDWDTAPVAATAILVEVSVNKGRHWKTAGTITIPVGQDEGYVNFRAVGSTLRFRFSSSSSIAPYYIAEYTMRVRLGGREVDVSTQA
jgi:hypothetical protein